MLSMSIECLYEEITLQVRQQIEYLKDQLKWTTSALVKEAISLVLRDLRRDSSSLIYMIILMNLRI
jgi:hypothetical protein